MGGFGLDTGGVGSGSFSPSLGTDVNVDTFGGEATCSPSVPVGEVRCGVVVDTSSKRSENSPKYQASVVHSLDLYTGR